MFFCGNFRLFAFFLSCAAIAPLAISNNARADTVPQTLPFLQDWSVDQITANDDWSGVPGVEGFLGQNITTVTNGADPQLLLGVSSAANDLDVVNNATNLTAGGVLEVRSLADPTIALQGSGTADAPYLLIHLDTTGFTGVTVAYNVRDLDTDDTNQQLALHYRVGNSGDFTNVPAAYIADIGDAAGTRVTPVSVVLPVAADNQAEVQIRMMTTNATGSDELVGIDDISVTGTAIGGPGGLPVVTFSQAELTAAEGNATGNPLTFEVEFTEIPEGETLSFEIDVTGPAGRYDDSGVPTTPVVLDDTATSPYLIEIETVPNVVVDGDATVTVTLSNFVGADEDQDDPLTKDGTILDDDLPTITIVASASVTEGHSGATAIDFPVTISPLPVGTVTLVATASIESGNTASADDFVSLDPVPLEFTSTGPATINATFQVVGDTTFEGDETFTVTLSGVSGDAVLGEPSTSIGTIFNDDILTVAQIQGTGASSPYADQAVETEGVITSKTSNAFWIQDNSCADPIVASCGIYVYTISAVAGPLAVGDRVRVRGTVSEYIPGSDPNQFPLTEIVNNNGVAPLVVNVLSSGNALPEPIDLSSMEYLPIPGPAPGGALDQFERLEGMRVIVPDFTVTVPTNNGEFASTSSSGTFFGVVSGTPRPRREAGIDIHNALPSGNTAANVPRWDFNSELIRVKTNLIAGGTALDLRGGSQIENLVGVLDYAFRRYTLLPDASVTADNVVYVPQGQAVMAPTPREFTVATFNVENLVQGESNYNRKVGKITAQVRDFLHLPDIIGLVEIGNQATASDLATKINQAVVSNGGDDPQYVGVVLNVGPYEQEVGLMYKTALVDSGAPRVVLVPGTVESPNPVQFGADDPATPGEFDGPTLICPDGVTDTEDALMDRPPLLGRFVVNAPNGASFPVSVMVNHLKALSGVDSEAPAGEGFECFVTDGARNRAKRHQGASYVASLAQGLQDENLVLVGDYNAYEVNDGLVDVIGTIIGDASPDDETVQPGDGTSPVTPPLTPLVYMVPNPELAYSYIFGSQAQVLDHIIVNEATYDALLDVRMEYAHVNADYRKSAADAGSTDNPFRSSDHDPGVAYFMVDGFNLPDPIFSDSFEGSD